VSNTQANNPPERESALACTSEPEEPEPRLSTGDPLPETVSVDLLWDECVSPWQDRIGISNRRIVDAVEVAARSRGFRCGQIGVRITDDAAIHEINLRYLSHDYPTDVISFPYSESTDQIEGELVASVESAEQHASDAGWDTASELLLYVIHGVLHIGGMDDHDEADRADMRRAERNVLTRLGMRVDPPGEENPSE
jgi:probable rRNA maturation factor